MSSANESPAATSESENSKRGNVSRVALALRYALVLLFLYLLIAHTTINRTQSEPTGLYAIVPLTTPVRFEQLVFACPSDIALRLASHYDSSIAAEGGPKFLSLCPNGGAALLKNVWGVPGDHMRVTRAGVWRNGRRIPYSKSALAIIPQTFTVPVGTVFVGSVFPYSYDSRIFGPVVARANAISIFTDWRWSSVVLDYDWRHRY